MDAVSEKEEIVEKRTKEILKQEGKSVLDKLINREKIQIIISIPLGLFVCLLSAHFFEAEGFYFLYPLALLLVCILSVPFKIYLYRYCKKIDYSNMSVPEISERVLKYQNIVQKRQIFNTIFVFVFLSVWYFLNYKLSIGSEINWWVIISCALFTLTVVLIDVLLIYKKRYFNKIKMIKENLMELQAFEML